jgi:hypothetical protein
MSTIIFWINSLPVTSAMLVNDVSELCTPQGASVLVDIILECINSEIDANGETINLPKTGTQQDQLRAAVRVLGQRVGWGNLAPALFEHDAADEICNGNISLVNSLLNDLRSIVGGGEKQSNNDNNSSSSSFSPPSSSFYSNKNQRRNSTTKRLGRSDGDTKDSEPPGPPSVQRVSMEPPSSTKVEDFAAFSADGLADLTDRDLESARNRIARILAQAEESLASKEGKGDYDEVEEKKSAGLRGQQRKKLVTRKRARRKQTVPLPTPSTRPWTAPKNGWNQSTETTNDNDSQPSRAVPVNVHHVRLRQKVRRVARDRGGRHRPAATAFHNREFQNGAKKVDKDGLVMDGMWDPTFAPSLRRLSELGFSPSKSKRSKANQNSHGDSDVRGTYYYHDAVNAPSDVSGHASSGSGSSVDDYGDGASYVIHHRASTTMSGVNKWKKELRTPSKKGKKKRTASGSDLSNVGQPTTPGGSRHDVFKGPSNVSHALSEKQMNILQWCYQLGVKPCKSLNAKDLTGSLVSAAFADGVLLCSLVANLEVRAGGRSANVTSGVNGNLTLEGTNCKPRTTASCTANLNSALKILRHRKNMNTRHLWSANALRNGDETTVWELLSDIEQEYSANRVIHGGRKKRESGRGKKGGNRMLKKKQIKTPGPSNAGSTLSGRKSTGRKSRRGATSLSANISQVRAQDITQRKPFGLLDPESRGAFEHGEEYDPYATDINLGRGSTIQKMRRPKNMTTTERYEKKG